MYNLITDVEAPIREFYEEVIKSEATGNTVAEAYTYLDEVGVGVASERQVPEYVDNTYVEQVTRPESKSKADLERVIILGKPLYVIDKFAAMVAVGEQWSYFDEFLAHLDDLSAIESYNADLHVLGLDDEGFEILALAKDLPIEPTKPVLRTGSDVLVPFNRGLFKASREALMKALTVTVDTYSFDGDEASQGRMARAVLVMDDVDTTGWVLADNTTVPVTKNQLMRALRLAGIEQTRIWS